MPDPLSPIQRTVMLRRVDLDRGMARFYSLMIERDLFGTVRLVRHWGRIGAMQGRELAHVTCLKHLSRCPPYRGGAVQTNAHGHPNVRGITRGEWTEEQERFTPAYQPPRLLDTLVLPATDGSKHWPKK